MEHDIYLALLGHEEKLSYLYEILVEKGIIPKEAKKDDSKEKKEEKPAETPAA